MVLPGLGPGLLVSARRFRFRPPSVASSPELRWVLGLAFSSKPTPDPQEEVDTAAAVELADRLSLLPRIAAREEPGWIALPAHAVAAERIRRARWAAAAAELKLDAALAAVAAAASALPVEVAVLKGRAIGLGGYSPPGGRPSSDIDLLIPEEALEPLRRQLIRIGFQEGMSPGYEHHAPILRDPAGTGVELHRHLPGVRLGGRRSATWEELLAADLLSTLPAAPTFPRARVPARELLIAHALVHALAQHGLSAAYPGWWLIADLIDLSIRDPATRSPAANWRRWIERDVSSEEIAAALALATEVEEGRDPLASQRADGAQLARHFVACALDLDYREALKTRWLESPVSDRPRPLARLALFFRAFSPPHLEGPAGDPPRRPLRAIRWLARPLVLCGKAASAALARYRLGRRRDRVTPPSPDARSG